MTEAPGPQLSRWTLWFGGLAFFTCYLGQVVLGLSSMALAGVAACFFFLRDRPLVGE